MYFFPIAERNVSTEAISSIFDTISWWSMSIALWYENNRARWGEIGIILDTNGEFKMLRFSLSNESWNEKLAEERIFEQMKKF